MAQIINGVDKYLTASAMSDDVGLFRSAVGNWNFTDDTGAAAAYPIFTLTGDVYIEQLYGLCQDTLLGAGTVEVGIAGATASIIAQVAGAAVTEGLLWQDAVPDAMPGVVTLLGRSWAIYNGTDIIFTIAGAVLTAGDINFYCNYRPLSPGATVVPA
jgi:hypothetical protein